MALFVLGAVALNVQLRPMVQYNQRLNDFTKPEEEGMLGSSTLPDEQRFPGMTFCLIKEIFRTFTLV